MMLFLITVLAAFVISVLAAFGMAAGVLAGRRPLDGSCGGKGLGGGLTCGPCGIEEEDSGRKP